MASAALHRPRAANASAPHTYFLPTPKPPPTAATSSPFLLATKSPILALATCTVHAPRRSLQHAIIALDVTLPGRGDGVAVGACGAGHQVLGSCRLGCRRLGGCGRRSTTQSPWPGGRTTQVPGSTHYNVPNQAQWGGPLAPGATHEIKSPRMSALAAQLAQLASLKGPQEHYVRGRASLLFDYQRAADVGAETLLSIAQTGGSRSRSVMTSTLIASIGWEPGAGRPPAAGGV